MFARRATGTHLTTTLRVLRASPRNTSGAKCYSSHTTPPRLRYISGTRPHQRSLRHSSISYTALGIALLLSVGGAYIGYQAARDPSPSPSSSLAKQSAPQNSIVASDDELAIALYGMASTIPPGRPGNLTEEQEQKLRDFWGLVLKVFGVLVLDSSNGSTAEADAPAAAAAQTEGGEKEKKKKRLGLFRKKDEKEKEKETAGKSEKPVAETPGLEGITVGDDKYGQIKEFKLAMASKSPEELRTALWDMAKHDHPDGLLLRFLRARKWELHPALVMLISTMQWRAEDMKVDSDIVLRGEADMIAESPTSKDAADFMAQLRMGKSFLHGVDKEGRPLCIVRVRLHHGGEQTENSLERFTVWTIETARMLLRPPVDTATIVFDMTNFSMANLDYTPVKFMIKCFEANYPESLGAVLVHKSPWIFQGIWKIIRGWLDPVVASKVHFTSNTAELGEFIDMKQIPTELGGEEEWDYSYVEPPADENALMKDTATRDQLQAERTKLVEAFEAKTVEWVDGDVSEEVKRERLRLAEQLRENYWKLDPYIRARTVYDRTGYLKSGNAAEAAPPAPPETKPVETNDNDVD